MAVTKGHGNPNWTRDETVLALDLYLSCEGAIPSKSDERVKNLSELLRSFPYHSFSARKESFRNPDGVAFKLQNIRNVATGKGLGNVSNMDKRIWNELGDKPEKVKELTALICSGIKINNEIGDQAETLEDFNEGRIVTETHLKRERNPNIRKRLLESRIQSDELKCELCNCPPYSELPEITESMFEAHHILPLSASLERVTKLKDMALLCANCHRMLHQVISIEKRWLNVEEAKEIIYKKNHA